METGVQGQIFIDEIVGSGHTNLYVGGLRAYHISGERGVAGMDGLKMVVRAGSMTRASES